MKVGRHRVGEPNDRGLCQIVIVEEVAAIAERVAVRDLDDESGARSIISDAPCRLVMMWLWTARSSICCPWAIVSSQNGLPHSVSASPPQMSFTRTPGRPALLRTDPREQLLHCGFDRVVGAYGDAPAPVRGD